MSLIGNIIWWIFGGLFISLGYFLLGLILYITIIGIPLAKQCFKLAKLIFAPFGKKVTTNFNKHPVSNILWLIFFGWEGFVSCIISGVILCITIIGIPFGRQYFKLAALTAIPFGATVS